MIYLIIGVSIDQNRNGQKGNQIFVNNQFLYQPSILVWNLCCLFRLLTIHFLPIPFNNKDQLDDEAPNPIEDIPIFCARKLEDNEAYNKTEKKNMINRYVRM